jgi:hypothetical protein
MPPESATPHDKHLVFADDLSQRATKHEKRAHFELMGAIILLLLAVVIFLFSAQIAKQDFSTGGIDQGIADTKSDINQVVARIDQIESNLSQARRECSGNYAKYFDQFLHSSMTPDNGQFGQVAVGVLPDGRDIANAITEFLSSEKAVGNVIGMRIAFDATECPTSISITHSRADFAKMADILRGEKFLFRDDIIKLKSEAAVMHETLDLRRKTYSFLTDRKAEAAATGYYVAPSTGFSGAPSSVLLAVQTNITRFGSLIIISVLVGLFFSLYKYDTKLAVFYSARADVFRLIASNAGCGLAVDALAVVLTPQVDFGKVPTTPAEQVIEMVRFARTFGDGKA